MPENIMRIGALTMLLVGLEVKTIPSRDSRNYTIATSFLNVKNNYKNSAKKKKKNDKNSLKDNKEDTKSTKNTKKDNELHKENLKSDKRKGENNYWKWKNTEDDYSNERMS